MKLRILALLSVLILCFSLVGCTGDGEGGTTREPLPVTGKLTVAVLQVGKADAIVVTTETKTLIIDAGESDDGGKVLNYLEDLGRTAVDHLLITHYDRDHVGGADRVLNFSEVKQVIRPDYVGEREEYDTFVTNVADLGVTDTVMAAGSEDMVFMMDDVEVTVNAPQKAAYTNSEGVQQDNNFSLVVTLRHGSQTLLFTGDCEDMRLAELITSDKNWAADFLKVPYHGNYTQLTAGFLGKVNPTYAVVCDSAKNPIADETLATLVGMNAQVYQTMNGTVLCESNGATLTVTQQTAEE